MAKANKDTILGFVAGLAAGALAGILLAPDSGAVTRRKLSGRYTGVENALDDTADDIIGAANDTAADIKAGANVIKDKVNDKYETWKEKFKTDLS